MGTGTTTYHWSDWWSITYHRPTSVSHTPLCESESAIINSTLCCEYSCEYWFLVFLQQTRPPSHIQYGTAPSVLYSCVLVANHFTHSMAPSVFLCSCSSVSPSLTHHCESESAIINSTLCGEYSCVSCVLVANQYSTFCNASCVLVANQPSISHTVLYSILVFL